MSIILILTRILEADNIIVATGSRPRLLPELPIDEEHVFTSDGLDKLDHFPKSIVIVGAGVIGCEFATIFSNFGKTKVHLIDKGDRILPFEDEDIVKVIERNLEAKRRSDPSEFKAHPHGDQGRDGPLYTGIYRWIQGSVQGGKGSCLCRTCTEP